MCQTHGRDHETRLENIEKERNELAKRLKYYEESARKAAGLTSKVPK